RSHHGFGCLVGHGHFRVLRQDVRGLQHRRAEQLGHADQDRRDCAVPRDADGAPVGDGGRFV
ncbi:hypothetical protein LPJ73_008596, partial [Coemansia sp. RSA 2703]